MLKVFIIDDEKLIREGLRNYIDWKTLDLEIAGTAGDGQDALQQILETRPDIIVCDICLPEMSGLELLSELRQKHHTCKFIFMSAYSEFRYAQEALRLGAFDYLLKPIDEDSLRNTLVKCRDSILAELVHTVPAAFANSPSEDTSTDSQSYRGRIVAQIVDYIAGNYSKDITLADVCNHVSLSASYTSKIFKEIVGCSLSRYIYQLRMNKSKELICTTSYKIYEIAEMVGYTDISHFSKKFKEYWGHSPQHYR